MDDLTASLRIKLAFDRSKVLRGAAVSKKSVRRHRFGVPVHVVEHVSYKTRVGGNVKRVVLNDEDERVRLIREKFAASREALYARLAALSQDDCGCDGEATSE